MFGNVEEAVVGIEACRRIVDDVYDDQPSGRGVAGSHGLTHGFGKQETTEAPTLMVYIHRQPGEQGNTNRVGRQSADKFPRRIGAQHRAHGQTEVAEDMSLLDQYEGSRRIHPLGSQCIVAKPVVKCVVAGSERGKVVSFTEAFQPSLTHASGSFGCR